MDGLGGGRPANGLGPAGDDEGLARRVAAVCCRCLRRVFDEAKDRDRCRWLRNRCNSSSCVSVCTRAFLITVNFVFLLSGWALFGLGVWIHVYKDSIFYAALVRDIDKFSLILIGVGGFVVTISFLGCCGACTESVCFLGFYAFLLVVAIISQICIASLASTFKQQILHNLEKNMLYQVKYDYNSTAKYTNKTDTYDYRVTKAWDYLQLQMSCCGTNGPQDYRDSSWYNHTNYNTGAFVPPSCCVLLTEDLAKPVYKEETQCQIEAIIYGNSTAGDNVKVRGCHAAIIEWIRQYEFLVSILCAVIFLQVVNFIYACILMSWVRKQLSEYSWCEEDEFQ